MKNKCNFYRGETKKLRSQEKKDSITGFFENRIFKFVKTNCPKKKRWQHSER